MGVAIFIIILVSNYRAKEAGMATTKSTMRCLLALWLLFLPVNTSWWFDEGPKEPSKGQEGKNGEEKKLVPFEVMTLEQKVLQEAKELLSLSPLDKCQHQVTVHSVIVRLYSVCCRWWSRCVSRVESCLKRTSPS